MVRRVAAMRNFMTGDSSGYRPPTSPGLRLDYQVRRRAVVPAVVQLPLKKDPAASIPEILVEIPNRHQNDAVDDGRHPSGEP